jgi:(p)ppGpp synthase/HD superfamily hydrolase
MFLIISYKISIIFFYLFSSLLNSINTNNFNNAIDVIKHLVNNKLHYENTISVKYEQRIKSQKRIIKKINAGRIPYDIYGLRIIYEDNLYSNNSEFAYSIKDLLYTNFNTIDCLYDDYIQYPKSNNYQSLHIYIVTNILIEVQIRNHLMNINAINGSASNYY